VGTGGKEFRMCWGFGFEKNLKWQPKNRGLKLRGKKKKGGRYIDGEGKMGHKREKKPPQKRTLNTRVKGGKKNSRQGRVKDEKKKGKKGGRGVRQKGMKKRQRVVQTGENVYLTEKKNGGGGGFKGERKPEDVINNQD